ncbi:MAG: hypothetical protein WBF53_03140 [Litorimonas sp.]
MTRRLLHTCALISALAVATSANADDYYLAISAQTGDESKPIIAAAKSAFDKLGPNDRLSVLDAQDGKLVVAFDIADKPRYKRATFKSKDYAAELRAFQSFVRKAVSTKGSDQSSDVIATLRAVGELRTDKASTTHLLLIAPGLHEVSQNASLSMKGPNGVIQVPSDGFLVGDQIASPYGRGTDQSSLQNVIVHYCAILPKVTPHESDEIARMWAHYIELNGGALATFSTDVGRCIKRYEQGVTTPLKVRDLDHSIEPAMIAADMSGRATQVTIDSLSTLETKLSDQTRTSSRQISSLKSDLNASEERCKGAEIKLAGYEAALGRSGVQDGVTDFSKFTHVAHPTVRSLSVTTGVSYDEGFPHRYETSWCYFNRMQSDGTSVKVEIGSKNYGKAIRWKAASDAALNRVSVSRAQFDAARQSCRFPAE